MAYEILRYAGVDLRTVGIYLDHADGIDTAPPVRGSNLVIPYQTGQRWASKFYDERHIVLNGDLASLSTRADMQMKIDQLKALFPIAAGEQLFEVQRADGSFRYCYAEVRNTMGLRQLFPTRWTPFSIELVAADPYWYSSSLEAGQSRAPWYLDAGVAFDDGAHWFDQTSQYFAQLLTGPIANVEASNSGDVAVRKILLSLKGLMVNPKITNLRNGLAIAITKTFGGQDTLLIDCGAQQLTVNGAIFPNTGIVTLGGAGNQSDWLRLEPGENTLQINLGGAGPVAYFAQYSGAWL